MSLSESLETTTMRRVYWRLIPLLFIGMFLNLSLIHI